MTAREAQRWKLYQRMMGRIGKERDDYNAAHIILTLRNLIQMLMAVNGVNAGEPVKFEECLLQFEESKNKTLEELIEEGREQALDFMAKLKQKHG